MDTRFAAFVAVAALLIVIPGPDMALVTRNVLIHPGDPPARLALMLAAYEVLLVAWLNVYGRLVARGARGRAGRLLRQASGAVLIVLGLRLATEPG